MELFSRSSRRSRYIVCFGSICMVLLVMYAAGSFRRLVSGQLPTSRPAFSPSVVCPHESLWAETLSFADGHVRLIQRVFASILAAVPEMPPSEANGGGSEIVHQALASDVTAECSRWRIVDNCSVCQVGPLRPKPGSCVVLAQSTPRATSLAAAFGCRPITWSLVGDHQTPVIDIFVADWGAQAMTGLTAALREGWLENVRQLVLGVDEEASWTQLRAFLSIVDRTYLHGFRQWRAPVFLGDSASTGRRRLMLLHFINQDILYSYAKLPPAVSPIPHLSVPDSLPTRAEVSLLQSFSRESLEHEIKASLATNRPSAMEVTYFRQVRNNHATCPDSQRIGGEADGGWDVCSSRPFSILTDIDRSSGCTAFSFGINYVFGYDNDLAEKFNCTVRMFDPSMTNMTDQRIGNRRQWFYQRGLAGKSGSVHGWKMRTLCSLIDEFTDSPNRVIDVLKIDIELWEWPSLETALAEGCLARVKQLLFETHTAMPRSAAPDYAMFLRVWLQLVRAGFRMWKWHENPQSFWYPSLGDSETKLPCCYEHYMLNWNYVR